ncbi:MAG: hypothetical protein ACREK1_05475 [Longimicrobiales bacterium]
MTGRTRTLVAAACLGLLFAHPRSASAQQSPMHADTVQLRFAWVPGTTARIESTRFQERIAESADTVAGSARYRMKVNDHVEGLLISYDDFAFPPPTDTSEAAKLNSLAEQAASIVPRFIVDSAGAFVRIDDAARVKAQFDTLLTRMLEPEEAAAAREGLDTMLSEDALTGLAAQEWNAIVGMWADADLVMGETYQFEEQAALPMIAGATVTMVSEFAIERSTACIEGGSDKDCVEIRLVSRPDPEAMKRILDQFMERLLALPGIGGLAFESLDVGNEMVLVTEPSTLRPHRVVLSRRVTGVVAADGERSEVSQVEVRTLRYTYSH